jgi:putative flippase GtrA
MRVRRREMVRFLLVGAVCFTLTTVLNYALKFTVLTARPVTALTLSVTVATIVSYVLNREWAFHTAAATDATTRRRCSS